MDATILTNAIATIFAAFVAGVAAWAKRKGEQLPDKAILFVPRVLSAVPLRTSVAVHRLAWPLAFLCLAFVGPTGARVAIIVALVSASSIVLVSERTSRLSMYGLGWIAAITAGLVLWLMPRSGTVLYPWSTRHWFGLVILFAGAVLFQTLGSEKAWSVEEQVTPDPARVPKQPG